MFSTIPGTIRREPWEFALLRTVGYERDLAVCAFENPDVFPFLGKFLSCRGWYDLHGSHEIPLSAVYGQHVGDQLAGHGQGGPVGFSSLPSRA